MTLEMTLDEIIDAGHECKHVSKVWVCSNLVTYDLNTYPDFYIRRSTFDPHYKLYRRKISASDYDTYIIGLDTIFDCLQVIRLVKQ